MPDSVVLNVVELCKSGSYAKLQTGNGPHLFHQIISAFVHTYMRLPPSPPGPLGALWRTSPEPLVFPSGIQDIISDAYSAGQIVEQLHEMVLEDGGLKDEQKCAIMNQLAVSSGC